MALVLPRNDHEEQEFRRPVDGDEEVLPRHPSSQDREVREVDVEESGEVLGELPDRPEWLWERGETVSGEDAVCGHHGQVREIRREKLDALGDGDPEVSPHLHEDPLLEFREGAMNQVRTSGVVLHPPSMLPLPDGSGRQPEFLGELTDRLE